MCLAVSILYMAVVLFFTKQTYAVNDDRTLISIFQGTFSGTPDGHGIYMLYPLSGFLKMLYTWNHTVEWYRLVMMGIYAFSIFAVLNRLSVRFEKHGIMAGMVFLGTVSWLWVGEICRFTYTTCAAFAAAALVLLYALLRPEEERKPGNLAMILILLMLSFTIRKECCFMAIPILGVIWLYKNAGQKLWCVQRWLIPAAALVCVAGILVLNGFAYRSDGWKKYNTYNKERTYLQDYGNFPIYSENEEFFESLGLSREEYRCIRNYRYMMLEGYSDETLHEIYVLAKSREIKKDFLPTVKTTIKRMGNYYFGETGSRMSALKIVSWVLPLILLFLTLYDMISGNISLRDGIFALLLPCAAYLLWAYIAYGGRFPDRIEKSLRILTIAASAAGLLLLFSSNKKRHIFKVLPVMAVICSILCGAAGFFPVWKWPEESSAEKDSLLTRYVKEHPENIYIKDARSVTGLSGKNVISTGGWSLLSPLHEEKLQNLGIGQMDRRLLNQKNVFLVAGKKQSIHDILGYSPETDISADIVEEFHTGGKDVEIYKVEISSLRLPSETEAPVPE